MHGCTMQACQPLLAPAPAMILRRKPAVLRALNSQLQSHTMIHSTANIFQLAEQLMQGGAGERYAVLRRMFSVTHGSAQCLVGPRLSEKYNMEQDNRQVVVSFTNRWTGEQAWFNEVRSRKPQTFKHSDTKPADPTGGGGVGKCDFCDWDNLTAQDPWGRIETEHAVTASNLFKYGEPYHGLALFKHHDPLSFSLDQLSHLMAVSQAWFDAAALHDTQQQQQPTDKHMHASQQLYPFFLWNALARAGASQYHGHAQLMATRVPVPTQATLTMQESGYTQQHAGCSYVEDLLAAYQEAGLLRACTATPEQALAWARQNPAADTTIDRAWIAASLSPTKDMEMIVALPVTTSIQQASSLTSTHTSSSESTLTDSTVGLFSASGSNGVDTFKVSGSSVHQTKGVHVNLSDSALSDHTHETGMNHGLPQHGIANPAFSRALHAALMALIDSFGIESFNVGILNVPMAQPPAARAANGDGAGDGANESAGIKPSCGGSSKATRSWIVAKVVSRGRMSQVASDFGGLEVLGGASIGHTDPYRVIQAVGEHLADCCVSATLPGPL